MAYCIVETESGWIVVETASGGTAEQAADMAGATVVDPGPYNDYEEAEDAMEALLAESDNAGPESDIPGVRALEPRAETD